MGSYKQHFFSWQSEIRGIHPNLTELCIIIPSPQENTGTRAVVEDVSLLFKRNISVFVLPIVCSHIVTCIQHSNGVQGQW